MQKSIHTREYKLFLELLRQFREEAGLSQQDMAFALKTTQSFVSKCERGERRLDVVELRSWCSVLGITMQNFVACYEETLNY